jgi:hypothetical protein
MLPVSQRSKVGKSKVVSGPPERAILGGLSGLSVKMLRTAEPLATFDLPTFDL